MTEGHVARFVLKEHFGFLRSGEVPKVFFHVRDFNKLSPKEPGPIVGEPVRFFWANTQPKRDPKAALVLRVNPPVLSTGNVYSFDPKNGWGFILRAGERVFFHREDFRLPWLPVVGTGVSFWESPGSAKPRAVQVECLR